MKKVDTFIRLFVDVLVNSFTDTSDQELIVNNQYSESSMSGLLNETQSTTSNSKSFLARQLSFTSHNSPVRLNDPKQLLANVETVFAISMSLKHFHVFAGAFASAVGMHSHQELSQLNDGFNSYRRGVAVQARSPVDELRT